MKYRSSIIGAALALAAVAALCLSVLAADQDALETDRAAIAQELFGHVRVGGQYEGHLSHDPGTGEWTIAFRDRLGLSPMEYIGYAFQGDAQDRFLEFTGTLTVGVVEDGVVVSGGGLRLTVPWAALPEPDPLAELRWVMNGNPPQQAQLIETKGPGPDFNDENCPGGWCWCTGPQGPAQACCDEGREPFCTCDADKSMGGCRRPSIVDIPKVKLEFE